jgi:tetratricopeptide (TPR) repeat protein
MATDVTDSVSFYTLWAWYEAHRKQVNVGAAVVVTAGLIAWFVLWRQEENAAQAGEAFSSVAVTQLSSANAPQVPEAYLKVAATYPASNAGAHALLLAAAGYFDEGKYPEAQAQFERFRREYHDNPLSGEALLGIAACLDAQGKTSEAINAYRDLVEHHPNDAAVLPQARFALGRLYEAQNQPQLARGYFEEAARTDSYGSIGSEAGMRLEELKIKYPQLGPTTPLPTNGPTFNIRKQ